MRVAALFSGGKDSTFAAWVASKKDELVCLITLFPKSEMSFMFHFPNVGWTRLQAQAIGVPQLTAATEGVKEVELDDLRRAIQDAKSRYGLEGVYTGALASVYQKSRVEMICHDLDLRCISPLWGIDPEAHLRRLVADGFSVMVVSVSALGLDQSWLGRTLDERSIDELAALGKKHRFHIGLEGGEGETFVLDAPSFSKRIEVRSATKHWRGDSGYLEISDAALVVKA
ncbi:MAG: diphthine--ammonia ligase [Nitrososphaerota archaeon]|jgi:ABC transporter with metal-binding/Fe-S-binding domain ATP-binding protein|nr:diphthine--ammonia ligase [Nitrososphaerota archaeon]MDG6943142.1 diphthine--ammonia ligase [Nitrososphaerota archaeon]MDG6950980.1 diphthine--ammonia ligase [Nitrososphaerota archaeon]